MRLCCVCLLCRGARSCLLCLSPCPSLRLRLAQVRLAMPVCWFVCCGMHVFTLCVINCLLKFIICCCMQSKLANLKLLQYCDRIENLSKIVMTPAAALGLLPPAASSITVQVADVIDGRHRMRHTKGQAHSGEAFKLLFHAAHRSLCSMTVSL